MHLSFSLYGADEAKSGDKKPQIQWHVLNLFLQSVGIVLTDVQDVIFKYLFIITSFIFVLTFLLCSFIVIISLNFFGILFLVNNLVECCRY